MANHTGDGNIKLQKFLQQVGYSRRKADELIKQNFVYVNKSLVLEPWYEIRENDVITVNGSDYIYKSQSEEFYYYAYHKPKGYVSSFYDPKEEKYIGKLIKEKLPQIADKLKIAGRLDKDVTGVLILTNDGELINILTSAKYGVEKVYLAMIKGKITNEETKIIKNGIVDEDEFLKCEDVKILEADKNFSKVKITMIKGKKHEVKRLMSYIDHPIMELKRISHGPVNISIVPQQNDLVKITGEMLNQLISLKKLSQKNLEASGNE